MLLGGHIIFVRGQVSSMKKRIGFLFLVLCSFCFASNKKVIKNQESTSKIIDEYYEQLSEIEKISQIFLVNIEGNKNYRAVEWTKEGIPVVPGGVLLFSYNIGKTPEEVILFTDSIANYCRKNKITCPYIAIDQEGGEVNRLGSITSNLSSCKKIAENYSALDAKKIYELQGNQLKILGINMNLAPVAEPQIEYNKDFLSRRSFGNIAQTIIYSTNCVRAYEENSIASVVKHFPGNSNTDPHYGLPIISLSQIEFERNFLLPFSFVITSGNPTCVLMSHAIVDGYSIKTPACLSSFWIEDILKNKIGYNGIIISDDIFMNALAKNGYPPEKAVIQAIEAGVDVLMLSEKKFLLVATILMDKAKKNPGFKNKIDQAAKKILLFKYKQGLLGKENVLHAKSIKERLDDFYKVYKIGQTYEK